MKVTLDLTDLVARGEITQSEAERLAQLGARDTGTIGSNILLSFGTVAVALGGGFLFPSAQTVIIIGAVLFAAGLALIVNRMMRWALFAQICVTVGALAIVGGVSFLTDGSFYVSLGLAAGLAAASTIALSGLLAALSVLELSAALGSSTFYMHASYFLGVDRPALTIGVLAVLTLALFLGSLRLPPAYARLAIIGARTAILIINLAFLVGSLFGDETVQWSPGAFAIAWALLLIGVGIWAVRRDRRWVVNAAAIFGALHFYTQWFEYLGANPLTVLAGGLLLIGFGFALRWFNSRPGRPRAVPPAAV